MQSVFRPVFGRVLAAAIGVLCAVGLVLSLIQDGAPALWQVGPWLVLVAGAVWATYWRPEVSVDDGGVHVVNVLRSIDLPWPSIQQVDTKWALTLVTAYGRYTAWAAPAPGGIATARAARRAVGGRTVGGRTGLGRTGSKDPTEPAYVPGRTIRPGDVPTSPSGAAAAEVRRRWEALRDAGYLADPRLESDHPPVRWHWPVILGAPAVLLIGVLSALLL